VDDQRQLGTGRERMQGSKSGAESLRGVSVLVVEDGWQVADALQLSLERMGMVVVGPVPTTREARGLAEAHKPEFAIVDINLDGEMAYALLDWLRGRGTRLIVMSGYEDLPKSLAKVAAILHKPFTPEALAAALQRAMNWEPP
jgi:DNA-binding NtrC family response regulator